MSEWLLATNNKLQKGKFTIYTQGNVGNYRIGKIMALADKSLDERN